MALEDGLQIKLEEFGLDEDQINEVVGLIEEKPKAPFEGLTVDESIAILKKEKSNEKGWKRRASIAAQIIALRLG